jgi:uncharacterized protein (DUF427 family)
MRIEIEREPVGPGEESVWDFPRPPRVERTEKRLEVYFNGSRVADTTRGLRVLETSHPPVYYFPPEDVATEHMRQSDMVTYCEWKGEASYLTLSVGGRTAPNAAWTYGEPSGAFRDLAGYIAFYPALMDECRVDGETAVPQPGGFYGGWITRDIKGPFKGAAGTRAW